MNELKYQIRNATIADAIPLAALANKGFKGYPFTSVYEPDSLAAHIANGEMRIVATLPPDHQRIIGTAVLGIDGYMAEIKRVIVDPEYRQNGMAKEMTQHLAQMAEELHVHPYTDTRADQIGMQRSSLAAGLKAISIEQGKHVVFDHEDSSQIQIGPARESMIHMTSLRADENQLHAALKLLPHETINTLHQNMTLSLQEPLPKDTTVVSRLLPSAKEVRESVAHKLERHRSSFKLLHDEQDICVIQNGNIRMVIVKPDASGFAEIVPSATRDEIAWALNLANEVGLQVITTYQDITDINQIKKLVEVGLEPSMIRPWQTDVSSQPVWQMGLRKTMNGYAKSLHTIKLDPMVKEQLEAFAEQLKKDLL